MTGGPKPPRWASGSLLDSGRLPVAELAALARRESYRPRPVYLAHKWFARRFGTAMRALLVAATLPADADFWTAFHGATDLSGLRVADLFVGGGTSLYEAHRLGADVIGVDVDPVACLVSRFELGAHERSDPREALATLEAACVSQQRLYETAGPDGDRRVGLHFFWVQQVACGRCGQIFDGHPDRLLAYGQDHQWVVCAGCGAVARQDKGRTRRRCPCGTTTAVREGTLRYGVATCPGCGEKERLIDQARRTGRPRFRLFAVESIPVGTGGRPVPIAERILHAASAADQARYARAGAELADLANLLPSRAIPVDGRSDDRLTDYGYRRYVELFNARQQLHLARLLLALPQADPDHRPALALALSNHLTANCMLTRYAARWRQVTPLFALRAYVHSPRPVELNPWLHATGRGTYPNAVRKVAQAIVYARKPREFAAGGFTPVPAIPSRTTPVVVHGDSRHRPEIADGSVHIVLTDPPYLDNIDYGELSDFYLPWLAAVGLTDDPGGPSAASLAAKGRGPSDAASFTEGLNACFREAARILHPGGRMIFTFQHQTAAAWEALGVAMHRSGLHAVTVLPLRGDGEAGLHRHEGSSTWDAVLVLRHPGPADGAGTRASGTAPAQGNTLARPPVLQDAEHLARCLAHADTWADRLALGAPDRLNLRRACIVAGVVGLHADPTGTSEATLVGLAKGLAASNPERAAAG